jgi:hypothetical protein
MVSGGQIAPQVCNQSVKSSVHRNAFQFAGRLVFWHKAAMRLRNVRHIFIVAGLALALAGCGKSERPQGPVEPKPLSPLPQQTVARIHWLGKKHLSTLANATNFMAIWNTPETARLEAQTLDKLSVAPSHWKGDSAVSNASSALLRPLLQDLVEEESWIEISEKTNRTTEMVLAIRLSEPQATLWQTKLAGACESLTGIKPAATPDKRGWSLKKHDAPSLVELTRIGEWTVVGLGQDRNDLLATFVARLERDPASLTWGETNQWLDAHADLERLFSVFSPGAKRPRDLPTMSLSMTGNGENVLTRGEMNFTSPLGLVLEPWNLPTNFVGTNVASFTAIRGIAPWLSSLNFWQDLQAGPPPNQFFCWGVIGFPMESYFAAPTPNASNVVSRLTDEVLEKAGPWLATNDWAKFIRSETFHGLEWKGAPYVYPFLTSVKTNADDFIFGGCFKFEPPGTAFAPELSRELSSRTNLVAYDCEITGFRIYQWTFMGQFLRLIFNRAQLPAESPSLQWFKANDAKLGNSVTRVTQTGPRQLSITRNSSIGFTAFELHGLADWLESPQFPRGSFSLLTPAPSQTETESSPPAPEHR